MSTPLLDTVHDEPAPIQGPSRRKQITRKILSWFHIIIVVASIAFSAFTSVVVILLGTRWPVAIWLFTAWLVTPVLVLVFIAESRRLRRKPGEYTQVDERFRPFNLLIVRAYLYMIFTNNALSVAGALLFFLWAIAKMFGFLSWLDDDEDLERLRLQAEATSTPVPMSVPADEGLTRTKSSRGWRVIRILLSVFHALTAITLLIFTIFAIIDTTGPRRIRPVTIYALIYAILILVAETRRFRRRTEDGPRDVRAVAFDDMLVRGVLYQVAACLLFSAEGRMAGYYNFPVSIAGYVVWGIGIFFCLLWTVAKIAGFLPRLQEEEGSIRLEESDDVQEPTTIA